MKGAGLHKREPPGASWRPTAIVGRPTAIKSWQRRSGEAHCDREVVDEVRRGGEEGGEAAQQT